MCPTSGICVMSLSWLLEKMLAVKTITPRVVSQASLLKSWGCPWSGWGRGFEALWRLVATCSLNNQYWMQPCRLGCLRAWILEACILEASRLDFGIGFVETPRLAMILRCIISFLYHFGNCYCCLSRFIHRHQSVLRFVDFHGFT